MVRFYHGSALLWEGQLEDRGIRFDATTRMTSVRAFGLRRKLDETSVRRIWSKRDLPGWLDECYLTANPAAWRYAGGSYDAADLTKVGVRYQGTGLSAVLAGQSHNALWYAPEGLKIVRIMFDFLLAGNVGNYYGEVYEFLRGGSYALLATVNANGSYSVAPVSHQDGFTVGPTSPTGFTPVSTDIIQFYNMRVLGTALTEDAPGGFYGGTILRDLIALCPELTIGIIEDGSEFTIQAIERSVRDATATSVVNEVAGYYTREWAVWEDGRFDWKTRNLDEPQWIAKLTDIDQLELDASTDDLARTVYVLYTDAASGLDAEASATATDQRNPYVRQAKTKDLIVTPGFPMTANTSAQLATVVAGDAGARPSVSGTCTLPADTLLSNAVGTAKPAALMRGGDNIVFPELPKTDVLLQGRDGETLFHIVDVELDVDANKITLTLEGQQRRTDVILARLAAATRVLTG